MEERVMVFVDGSNLYHSLRNHFKRTDLDLGRFCQKLLCKRQLIRIYYYNATVGQKQEPELYKQQQSFFNGIKAIRNNPGVTKTQAATWYDNNYPDALWKADQFFNKACDFLESRLGFVPTWAQFKNFVINNRILGVDG